MQTDQDAARIAEGLTKAQITLLTEISRPSGWVAAIHLGLGQPSTVGAILSSLILRGLVERRHDQKCWRRHEYRVLPLGLAVRALLEKDDQ